MLSLYLNGYELGVEEEHLPAGESTPGARHELVFLLLLVLLGRHCLLLQLPLLPHHEGLQSHLKAKSSVNKSTRYSRNKTRAHLCKFGRFGTQFGSLLLDEFLQRNLVLLAVELLTVLENN